MGGWVAAAAGELGPACTNVQIETPLFATAGAHARVWRAPTIRSGVLYTLAPGSHVMIIGGPVRGSIRTDTTDEGDWYEVYQTGRPAGWVWA